MPIVSSVGSLQTVQTLSAPTLPLMGSGGGSSSIYGYGADAAVYAALYRSQPSVRTCVDFLARNMAQLGIHIFRRVSDTDRQRLADHDLANWLNRPSPYTTRYRLIETLVQDLGIHWNAYWLKIRMSDRIGLQRLPPEQVEPIGGLAPSFFRWTTSANEVFDIPTTEVVAFNGFNPANPLAGLSPLETLRRLLAEDIAASEHRASFWRNAARIEGVVERPLAAKTWSPEQVDSYRAQWAAKFAGAGGVGSVPVLQEGMTFKSIAFSPRQAEYTTARKLTREEVAAEYHIPLPMVGILDHATFSNIREQHKQLYQDTLGPWCIWLMEEIERQLLIECDDQIDIYGEFNISEKLSGDFDEQAGSLRTLIGRPIMTANEGRARLNLPAIDTDDANSLARPLNTTTNNTATNEPPREPEPDEREVAQAIAATWQRQAAVVAKSAPELRAADFDAARWTRELAADLVPIYQRAGFTEFTAHQRARRTACIVNEDTRLLLEAGIAAFEKREASVYVP